MAQQRGIRIRFCQNRPNWHVFRPDPVPAERERLIFFYLGLSTITIGPRARPQAVVQPSHTARDRNNNVRVVAVPNGAGRAYVRSPRSRRYSIVNGRLRITIRVVRTHAPKMSLPKTLYASSTDFIFILVVYVVLVGVGFENVVPRVGSGGP